MRAHRRCRRLVDCDVVLFAVFMPFYNNNNNNKISYNAQQMVSLPIAPSKYRAEIRARNEFFLNAIDFEVHSKEARKKKKKKILKKKKK